MRRMCIAFVVLASLAGAAPAADAKPPKKPKLDESKLLKLNEEISLTVAGRRERPLENGFVRTTIWDELTIEPVGHSKSSPRQRPRL
jgi:hypothetical protein